MLILPFNLLFHRYSRSDNEYFPRFHIFSSSSIFTSFVVGLSLQLFICSLTDVLLVQCSLCLLQYITVVFPEYCSVHLHRWCNKFPSFHKLFYHRSYRSHHWRCFSLPSDHPVHRSNRCSNVMYNSQSHPCQCYCYWTIVNLV